MKFRNAYLPLSRIQTSQIYPYHIFRANIAPLSIEHGKILWQDKQKIKERDELIVARVIYTF
jgi:hypothetical protein